MKATLNTARLILRMPLPEDAERIAFYLNNIAVSGNLARVPHPYFLGDAKAWLRTRRDDLPPEETNFTIEVPGLGLAGAVGFHIGMGGQPVIGYWLGQPFWGRGYMTEAAWAALDWYFDVTAEDRVLSGVFDFNTASLNVQTKLGFTEIGRSTMHCLARNAEVRHIDTELTRKAWIGQQR